MGRCDTGPIKFSHRGVQLYQNCAKTLSNCDVGAYFEREADSPKLLETLGSEVKEWNRWNAGSCLQSRGARGAAFLYCSCCFLRHDELLPSAADPSGILRRGQHFGEGQGGPPQSKLNRLTENVAK